MTTKMFATCVTRPKNVPNILGVLLMSPKNAPHIFVGVLLVFFWCSSELICMV
jgi:hypothetical protein